MTPAVKSRGIIFRGDMVRAILAGAKSQTRRLVTLREFDRSGTPGYDWTFRDHRLVWNDYDNAHLLARKCPYGVPGSILWVRETFGVVESLGADRDHDGERYVYRADPASAYQWDGAASQGFRWRPSIFMPREASRLTLVVESVRVERLSAITGADAKAEGFDPYTFDFETQHVDGSSRPVPLVYSARDQYLRAFRAMHKLAADADPWLWVIGFRKQGGAK